MLSRLATTTSKPLDDLGARRGRAKQSRTSRSTPGTASSGAMALARPGGHVSASATASGRAPPEGTATAMRQYSCTTCAAQFAAAERPLACCPICQDERQYVGQGGLAEQAWATRGELIERGHHNVLTEVEAGVVGIDVEPKLGIGQRCFLLQTDHGGLLWDCVGLLHPDTVEEVQQKYGRIEAIVISHPHFYAAMVDWAEAFDCPVWVHEADRKWVTRPSSRIQVWEGEQWEALPGCTLVRLGGHFPGSSVLHWRQAPADGKPVLFAGDTILPCMDRRYVTFMYSFPNYVPLPSKEVLRMADTVGRWRFDRLYGSFPNQVVQPDARDKVLRSAERYCGVLDGT